MRNLFAKRRSRNTKPTHESIIVDGFQVRPWWGVKPAPDVPATRWTIQRKGTGWLAPSLATICEPASKQAYIVSSSYNPEDAFISWDDALREAIRRAKEATS